MIKKYWMIVASKNHVETGKELGIIQACHGKAAPLKRMKNGDGFIFYSSKFTFRKGSLTKNLLQLVMYVMMKFIG